LWKWIRTTYIGKSLSYAAWAFGALNSLAQMLSIFHANLFEGEWLLLPAFASVSVLGGLLAAVRRKIAVTYKNGLTIKIVKGDLLEEPNAIYVAFTDSFGVGPSDHISPTSLQGKYLESIWHGDELALREAVENGLLCSHGPTLPHEVGCVSLVTAPNGKRAYCVAQSHMNSTNKAKATTFNLVRALENFYAAVNQQENHGVISIPIIGQGLSRVSGITPSMAIELIALTAFTQTAEEKFTSEIRIVAQPEQYRELNLREIDLFLRTLA
jgi:Domain of unknown function (DUF6430)